MKITVQYRNGEVLPVVDVKVDPDTGETVVTVLATD